MGCKGSRVRIPPPRPKIRSEINSLGATASRLFFISGLRFVAQFFWWPLASSELHSIAARSSYSCVVPHPLGAHPLAIRPLESPVSFCVEPNPAVERTPIARGEPRPYLSCLSSTGMNSATNIAIIAKKHDRSILFHWGYAQSPLESS